MTGLASATHEAAHAVVAHLFGGHVRSLGVRPQLEGSFACIDPLPDWRHDVLVSLAGGTAQLAVERRRMSVLDERDNHDWLADLNRVDELISRHHPEAATDASEDDDWLDDQVRSFLAVLDRLLADPDLATAIKLVADELLQRGGTLTGDDVRIIVAPLLDEDRKASLRALASF
jgi:hypothetical protein